jgi:dTDP-4-amino-4,6-dideoxygalactose transaminase
MIPAFDGRQEYRQVKDEIDAAIRRVCESGRLILGPEVEAFEHEFAAYVGARYAVGVKSGTDALIVALRALEIGPGDEVITVANTAVATVAAIRAVGATPRFVDIDRKYLLMDVSRLEAAITPRTRCILPVHLYGHPADMPRISAVAQKHRIPVVADCAQAHGASLDGQHVGTFADIGCFSFYPTKNLGAMGDGGLCTTQDPLLADRIRRIRCYGFDGDRIAHLEGMCSRLDELQAAILRVKLGHLDDMLRVRRRLADIYTTMLQDAPFWLPSIAPGAEHAFHLYVIRTMDREGVIARLERNEIGYGIHYPVPIHLMPAYEWLDYGPGDLPVTEQAAGQVLSLPLHAGLTEEQVRSVASVLLEASSELSLSLVAAALEGL